MSIKEQMEDLLEAEEDNSEALKKAFALYSKSFYMAQKGLKKGASLKFHVRRMEKTLAALKKVTG